VKHSSEPLIQLSEKQRLAGDDLPYEPGCGGFTTRIGRPWILRIRVSSAELIDELLAFLRAYPDAVITQISDDEAEVMLLGSFHEDALRMELYLRLRAWEAAHSAHGVHVEIVG
jgi:hypothetical protein